MHYYHPYVVRGTYIYYAIMRAHSWTLARMACGAGDRWGNRYLAPGERKMGQMRNIFPRRIDISESGQHLSTTNKWSLWLRSLVSRQAVFLYLQDGKPYHRVSRDAICTFFDLVPLRKERHNRIVLFHKFSLNMIFSLHLHIEPSTLERVRNRFSFILYSSKNE